MLELTRSGPETVPLTYSTAPLISRYNLCARCNGPHNMNPSRASDINLQREISKASGITQAIFSQADRFLEKVSIPKNRTRAPATMPSTTMSAAQLQQVYEKQLGARDSIGHQQGVHTIWMRRHQQGDLSAGDYDTLTGIEPGEQRSTSPLNRWKNRHDSLQ